MTEIQHVLNEEYYDRIEAIQFTMNHDDGNLLNDIEKSDIILVGVSRTSKTPTSIYLANKGFKTSNIPLVNENSLPKKLRDNPQLTCVVGLNTEPERLVDLRKNRMNSLKETENIKIAVIATQKSGALAAVKEITLEILSKNPFGLYAAKEPIKIAPTRAIDIATAARDKVTGIASKTMSIAIISDATVSPFTFDVALTVA